MEINAKGMHFAELDRLVKDSADENIVIDNVLGQRYIAAGAHGKHITINGIPGNALGAYLNDCTIEVNGNGQDAVGDTMNAGKIIIHGNCGDTAGYGMRDGGIFIRGYAGWRVGIHMKQYGTHIPKIVVGGTAGSYLGEYLDLPQQVEVSRVTDKSELEPIVREFCSYFPYDAETLLSHDYFVLKPSTVHIYSRMYCNRSM